MGTREIGRRRREEGEKEGECRMERGREEDNNYEYIICKNVCIRYVSIVYACLHALCDGYNCIITMSIVCKCVLGVYEHCVYRRVGYIQGLCMHLYMSTQCSYVYTLRIPNTHVLYMWHAPKDLYKPLSHFSRLGIRCPVFLCVCVCWSVCVGCGGAGLILFLLFLFFVCYAHVYIHVCIYSVNLPLSWNVKSASWRHL